MTEERKDRNDSLATSRSNLQEIGEPDAAAGGNVKRLKFRNYTPRSASIIQRTEQRRAEDSQSKALSSSSVLAQALAKARAEQGSTKQRVTEPITPRKVNWDLKRDIQSKLDKLERKTQRAIVELLRERLEKEATAQDID